MKLRRYVYASPLQHATHPDKLVQEVFSALLKSIVEQFPLVVEERLNPRKIEIGKADCQSQLTYHRHHRFDHARATPWTSRYANERDCFVYVLAQQQIEYGF